MRQLFTWRFVAVIAALAGLALVLNAVLLDSDEITAIIEPEIPDRRIDLIASVQSAQLSSDFFLGAEGVTEGYIDFVFEGDRVMRVAPGTTGEIDCPQVTRANQCAVFADLLGDAVIWFAVLPQGARNTVELPPILDLEDNYALFENGWQILYPPVIDRQCDGEDIVSFSDFLRRFGPRSTTIVDIETQQVTAVRCAGTGVAEDLPETTEVPVLPPIDELPLAPEDFEEG